MPTQEDIEEHSRRLATESNSPQQQAATQAFYDKAEALAKQIRGVISAAPKPPLVSVPIDINDTPGTRKALLALLDGDYNDMSNAEKAFRQILDDAFYLILKDIRTKARALQTEGRL